MDLGGYEADEGGTELRFWATPPFLMDSMPFKHVKSLFGSFSFLSLQLGFDLDREVYPLVVHAVVDEGDGMLPSVFFCCTRCPLVAPGLAAAVVPQQPLVCGSQPIVSTSPHTCSQGPWANENTSGFYNVPLRDSADISPIARNWGRSVGIKVYCLVCFPIHVPFSVSEYFGHCHVLLGTFEKVSG